jgi:hypothetical protein
MESKSIVMPFIEDEQTTLLLEGAIDLILAKSGG